MEQVGVVGTGAMGSALLHRLALADVPATAYDQAPSALEEARAEGAAIADSPAAVARQASIIDIVVRTDDEIVEAVLGEAGVLAGAAENSLVLLHSTTLPQTTVRVAEAAQAHGVHVMDACMLGVPETVRAGHVRFLVGGPDHLVERARPHLLHMGEQAIHVGPLGSGNVLKLIHNLLSGAETLLLHEALLVGEAAGIPYPHTLDLLRDISGGRLLQNWQRTFDPSGVDPTPRVGFNTLPKDVPLAGELATLYGLDTPIIQALATAALRLTR